MKSTQHDRRQPIIKSFKVSGLHGYKDVSLEFVGPARIAIAENGSGKTTFLSAMNAFMNADFEKLSDVSFTTIECCFSGLASPLVLTKAQLPEAGDERAARAFQEIKRWSSLSSAQVRQALREVDTKQVAESVRRSPVLQEIYQRSPWQMPEMADRVRAIRSIWNQLRNDTLDELSASIKTAMTPHTVLYLPTYRRVELPLAKRAPQTGSHQQRLWFESAELRLGNETPATDELGIQYGLADVQERLHQILSEIQRLSTQGYRSLSANIIDDLLDVGVITGPDSAHLPPVDALALFLSRIEQSPDSRGRRLDAIKGLYASGDIDSSGNNLLRYFLGKLSRAVDQTRELEASIEQFVVRANVYLEQSSDEKRLEYDPGSMRVFVRNLWTGAEVRLDDLSSGEKQVVSLLAHFYLYQESKILLIDEPELSLSIEWQRKLLPDVLASPTCAQLLAITHSPFIFDNELDPYAGPLIIERAKQGQQ